MRLFPEGSAPMWGITPGKGNRNLATLSKISTGDWVFFSGDKRLYLGGTIALRWRNKAFAERLWGLDDKGLTWEYMYALSGIQGFDIPVEEVRNTPKPPQLETFRYGQRYTCTCLQSSSHGFTK